MAVREGGAAVRRVIIESPLAGNTARNIRYARLCLLDCLRRGEAGYASHLLYTQVLDDTSPADRELGMAAGFAWNEVADIAAVYTDLGVSGGMLAGMGRHESKGTPVETRVLPADLMALLDQGDMRSTPGAKQ